MSMDKAKMAKEIMDEQDKLNPDSAKATDYISAMAKMIKAHIEDNAEASARWVGVSPASGAPDTTTQIEWEITIPALVIQPSNLSDQTASMAILGAQLFAGLSTSLFKAKTTGFVPPVLPLIVAPSLSMLMAITLSGDDRQKATEDLCGQIISAITSIPIPPIPGMRAAYVGSIVAPIFIS